MFLRTNTISRRKEPYWPSESFFEGPDNPMNQFLKKDGVQNQLTNIFSGILALILELEPGNKTVYVSRDEESDFSGPGR